MEFINLLWYEMNKWIKSKIKSYQWLTEAFYLVEQKGKKEDMTMSESQMRT